MSLSLPGYLVQCCQMMVFVNGQSRTEWFEQFRQECNVHSQVYIVCGAGIKLSAASLVIFCANVYCHLSHSTDHICSCSHYVYMCINTCMYMYQEHKVVCSCMYMYMYTESSWFTLRSTHTCTCTCMSTFWSLSTICSTTLYKVYLLHLLLPSVHC